MKRYIQILVMVMCVMAFGAKIKAQEEVKTNYNPLVYYAVYVPYDELFRYANDFHQFVDNMIKVHDRNEGVIDTKLAHFSGLIAQISRPLRVVYLGVQGKDIVLTKKDTQALSELESNFEMAKNYLEHFGANVRDGVHEYEKYTDLSDLENSLIYLRDAQKIMLAFLARGERALDNPRTIEINIINKERRTK